MGRLPGLRHRLSKEEQLELEIARERSLERLERLVGGRRDDDPAPEGEAAAVADGVSDGGDPVTPTEPAGAVMLLPGDAGGLDSAAAEPVAAEPAADVPVDMPAPVGVMDPDAIGRPAVPVTADADPVLLDAPGRRAARRSRVPAVVIVEEGWDVPSATDPDPRPAGAAPAADAADATDAADDAPAPGGAPRRRSRPAKPAVPPPPPRPRRSPGATHPRRAPRRKPPVVLAACPSCAVLLDPPPSASRRCAACRERIVVKRLEGGVLYLTAAAGAALEAGQRQVAERARLARIRDRWLALAGEVGAATVRIDRLASAVPTDDTVAAARTLYLAAADRAAAAATRERRPVDVVAVRRAQAAAVHRDLGAPVPPPDEVAAWLREAATAELKACRAAGRDAELAAGSCCDACREDGGRVTRIADELKLERLPHASCERGLCRCRWVPARVAGRRPVAGGAR